MTDVTLVPGARDFPLALAGVIVRARELIGWSQRELARRARTSQATIWRLEHANANGIDMDALHRVLVALGLQPRLLLADHHLEDRRRQRDGLHVRVNGYCGRRLERLGWAMADEVQLGGDRPMGWIDLLCFREEDGALLIEESKTDIPDMGATQGTLSLYERRAWEAARRLGWQPRTINVLLVGLDSHAMAARLRANRELVARVFPIPAPAMTAWLRDPRAPRPNGWSLALCDPASRAERWLRPTTLGSRRLPVAYRDYADAASRLLRP